MGQIVSNIKNNVDGVTNNISAVLVTLTNVLSNVQQDASGSMTNVTNECFKCLHSIRDQVNCIFLLLSHATLAIIAVIALSVLLYHTSSPVPRFILWIVDAALCLHLVHIYFQHSVSSGLPASEQHDAPIEYENQQLQSAIAQLNAHSEIKLIGRQLTDKDMHIIVREAIINKQCTQLRLGCNRITSAGALILANALNNNNTLNEVSLWNNRISDIGVLYLTEQLLTNNNSLKKLDLSENGVTDEGVLHIVEMLKRNTKLTHIALSKNQITNQGIRLLAKVLEKRNNTLEVLSLTENNLLNDTSVDYLVNMFASNQSLRKLWIDKCNLSKKGQKRLEKAVQSKKKFRLHL